jgi:hypothetical protein
VTQRIVGSYTFFNELDNCPFKAYEVRIARSIQRLETQVQRWGNYVHDAMEKRIGEGKPLPEDAVQFEPYAMCFDGKVSVRTEMKLGIQANGMPCKFWGDGCYVAGKIDVVWVPSLTHTDITDWKTGKEDYETPFELELHALLHAAATAPIQSRYTARYAYIGRENRPDKVGQTYDTANGTLASPQQTWAKVNGLMARAFDYQRQGHWPKQPNALCGWCPVTKCEHNKTEARLAKEGLKK